MFIKMQKNASMSRANCASFRGVTRSRDYLVCMDQREMGQFDSKGFNGTPADCTAPPQSMQSGCTKACPSFAVC